MSIDWIRFAETVRGNRRFILTSHMRPDCDALGSELGMALILECLGKEVWIVNPQPTPPSLRFLDSQQRIKAIGVDVQASDLDDFDVLMVLDTSAWAQLGPMGDVLRQTQATRLVLDHHVSQDDLGAQMFKDVEAEATGRLVAEAADQLGVTISPQIALPLFAAVATDTGWFRFRSTRGDTMRLGGRLIDAGVQVDQLYSTLYEQDSLARLKLIGRVLDRAQTELDGRLIHTSVRGEDFQATGALPSDTEDVINMLLTVAGTQAAFILVEQPDGKFKVSFRSRGKSDCSAVAEQLGGGGHKAAAGAMVDGPYHRAHARVLDLVSAAMQ